MMASQNGKSSLFLGDLSIFCTEKSIEEIFSQYGDILEIKIMRSEETNRNLSYGFLKFSTVASAKKAMTCLNGYLLCGRPLRIRWASYKNKMNPQQKMDGIETSPVHVSFISYQVDRIVTEDSLRILFSNYGNVVDSSIKKSVIDRDLKRQSGYGFVHYPLCREGIEAAIVAAGALNDVTVEQVNYKCSISHNLNKHLSGDLPATAPVSASSGSGGEEGYFDGFDQPMSPVGSRSNSGTGPSKPYSEHAPSIPAGIIINDITSVSRSNNSPMHKNGMNGHNPAAVPMGPGDGYAPRVNNDMYRSGPGPRGPTGPVNKPPPQQMGGPSNGLFHPSGPPGGFPGFQQGPPPPFMGNNNFNNGVSPRNNGPPGSHGGMPPPPPGPPPPNGPYGEHGGAPQASGPIMQPHPSLSGAPMPPGSMPPFLGPGLLGGGPPPHYNQMHSPYGPDSQLSSILNMGMLPPITPVSPPMQMRSMPVYMSSPPMGSGGMLPGTILMGPPPNGMMGPPHPQMSPMSTMSNDTSHEEHLSNLGFLLMSPGMPQGMQGMPPNGFFPSPMMQGSPIMYAKGPGTYVMPSPGEPYFDPNRYNKPFSYNYQFATASPAAAARTLSGIQTVNKTAKPKTPTASVNVDDTYQSAAAPVDTSVDGVANGVAQIAIATDAQGGGAALPEGDAVPPMAPGAAAMPPRAKAAGGSRSILNKFRRNLEMDTKASASADVR